VVKEGDTTSAPVEPGL